MTVVVTVTGNVDKHDGHDWEVKENGLLVVRSGQYKTVYAVGQWVSVREHGK